MQCTEAQARRLLEGAEARLVSISEQMRQVEAEKVHIAQQATTVISSKDAEISGQLEMLEGMKSQLQDMQVAQIEEQQALREEYEAQLREEKERGLRILQASTPEPPPKQPETRRATRMIGDLAVSFDEPVPPPTSKASGPGNNPGRQQTQGAHDRRLAELERQLAEQNNLLESVCKNMGGRT